MNNQIKVLCTCGCKRTGVVMGYATECLDKKRQRWEADERKSPSINHIRPF